MNRHAFDRRAKWKRVAPGGRAQQWKRKLN